MKKIIGISAMLAAAILWGAAFSAQKKASAELDIFVFIFLRSLISVPALMLIAAAADLCRCGRISLWGSAKSVQERRELLAGGILCGTVITFAAGSQQAGVGLTTAGKTGFLTVLYIIFVPLLGIFFKRRTSPFLLLSVCGVLGGAYLLCGGISSVGPGELWVILCAFIYAVHIIVTDRYASDCDCIRLSCIQFMTATVLSLVLSFIFSETYDFQSVISSSGAWIFCGLGSSAAAFTLQIFAQKYLHPVAASLLMTLEAVFAALGGWFFFREVLSPEELAGCILILLSVMFSQLSFGGKSGEKANA